jgi:hypothetical protein
VPIVYADRVQETTTSTGTGAVALGGAVLGFRTFVVGVGVGNQSYYAITDDLTGDWEVGIGTLGVGTFSRDAVFSSSNANMLVSLVVGTKKIFTVSPATFFTGALLTADHGTTNHTGIPGVPAAEAFTAPVHATTSHTAIPGVGNLATAPGAGLTDHATVNHAGIPGVPAAEAFTAGVHATTDHAGITGAGLTTKQSLIFPASLLHQYWRPNSNVGPSLGESFLPSTVGGDEHFSDLLVDQEAGSAPSIAYVNSAGFGAAMQYFFGSSGHLLRIESTNIFQNLLPRLVVKAKVTAAVAPVEYGISVPTQHTGSFATILNGIWARWSGIGTWSIERRVGGVTKTSTVTGVAAFTGLYVLFNYTGTTSVTVTFYDAATFAVLFTTTFSGAAEVPAPSTIGRVRVHCDSGGVTTNLLLSSMLLSYND